MTMDSDPLIPICESESCSKVACFTSGRGGPTKCEFHMRPQLHNNVSGGVCLRRECSRFATHGYEDGLIVLCKYHAIHGMIDHRSWKQISIREKRRRLRGLREFKPTPMLSNISKARRAFRSLVSRSSLRSISEESS